MIRKTNVRNGKLILGNIKQMSAKEKYSNKMLEMFIICSTFGKNLTGF
jgi:hypothetical protein